MDEIVEVDVSLESGMKFIGRDAEGHEVVMDAAPEHGGEGAGFRPMALLLISFGTCTAMDAVSIMRKKRQDVARFSIHVKGTRVADHPRVYSKIEVRFVFYGRDLSEEAARRSVELSQEKYCSVGGMLKKAVPIEVQVETRPS